jgi:phospholipase C
LKKARVQRSAVRTLFWIIPSILLPFLFAGCGGPHVTANTAPTVTIAANPATVNAGATSTLTVAATNATSVAIAGSDGSSYTLQAAGGTQAVTPSATTTYTVTAVGAGGKASATATVTVNATTTPAPTVTISANPASITAGASSTLTVAATNATSVTITGSDSSSYTLATTGGTQAVSPKATTTYTATATGAGGTVTATATVTVTAVTAPAPTITITANPTAITAGTSSILTVSATNATTVTIAGSDKSSYTLAATGGTQAVSPAASTTYTATATGPGGTITATATVTVSANPIPTVTITANPASITVGSSSTLTVAANYATQVTITGSDGTTYPVASGSGGNQTVTPAATTTYTATAIGAGGTTTATATVTVTPNPQPTVTIAANPTKVVSGSPSTLTVAATNATGVTITGSDNSSYSLPAAGGTQSVSPTATTIYTATATGATGTTPATAQTTVTVIPAGSVQQINHVIFEQQENHSFDNYFGMLNPYRVTNNMNVGDDGVTYTVDGIDDKLSKFDNQDDEGQKFPLFKFTTTCNDDMSSDWLASFGDVDRYNFDSNRGYKMDGFVHNAEGYAKSCAQGTSCSGNFTDLQGERAMGYYDEGYLNYYYYMASQFAVSDRWFSPVASKSIDNRIATFSGGTTQGLVRDPAGDDKLASQLNMQTIFQELDNAHVSWKIYYTVTQGFCQNDDECGAGLNRFPATDFNNFSYSFKYLNKQFPCAAPLQPSSVVGDSTNSFCIDPTHIAPVSQYMTDVANGTLPSFAFIEAGYANNDEHPGSGQSILSGQNQVSKLVNALMNSPSWNDSVFFFSYDEGGGPFDHVPPVPKHSNDNTDAAVKSAYPDIAGISVNPDTNPNYFPCVPPQVTQPDGTLGPGPATTHCDLESGWPGSTAGDLVTQQGFAAQLGFRLPNFVVSPFTRRHYVSHTPIDHTAIIKFVENRFIGPNAHLTNRDAAQPDLLDFFDFTNIPWATPPTPPAPITSVVSSSCHAATL